MREVVAKKSLMTAMAYSAPIYTAKLVSHLELEHSSLGTLSGFTETRIYTVIVFWQRMKTSSQDSLQ